MHKSRITRCFSQAHDTYDQQAFAQKKIAKTLSQQINQTVCLDDSAKIWEFGCGTGDFSLLLLQHFAPQKVTLNDLTPLSATCLNKLQAFDYTFAQGDMEQMDLGDATCDLICGSSAIQWFADIPQFIDKCHRALNPGGYLAFSSFLSQNLIQIRSLTGVGLHYYNTTEWEELLRDFEILVLQSEEIDLLFESPMAILKHLKATGVNGIGRQRWTPSLLNDFVAKYTQRYNQHGKVVLTYHPIYIIAKKRNK